jgi:hypothetical protein
VAFPVAVRLGVDQESGAAVEFGTDEIQTALSLLPVLDHDIFQLFVEELFRGLFELRIDFNEIGQYAQRGEVAGFALFERREEPLHGFGGVGAMGEHLFQ